jgi:dienelactone hydrolase
MTEIVLFHHAQGLTPGVTAFADTLRAAGNTVHTPDLYEGQTFDALEAGVAHAQEIGIEALSGMAVEAVADVPAGAVYGGISLGVGPAQMLAQTREGAQGALLIAACLPRSEFGTSWPAWVPVQIHAMEHDSEFDNGWDLPAAREIVAEATDGELFLYPGDQHLFMDSSLPAYDAGATALLAERVLAFLDRIDA